MGQLAMLIRSKYLVDAEPMNKVEGKPFKLKEIYNKIKEILRSSMESNSTVLRKKTLYLIRKYDGVLVVETMLFCLKYKNYFLNLV